MVRLREAEQRASRLRPAPFSQVSQVESMESLCSCTLIYLNRLSIIISLFAFMFHFSWKLVLSCKSKISQIKPINIFFSFKNYVILELYTHLIATYQPAFRG